MDMEITKEKLYGTRYIDPDHTLIGVTLQDPENKELTEIVVPADPNKPEYQTLLSIRNIEQLEQSHAAWIDNAKFEEERIAAWQEAYKFTPDQLRQIAKGEMPQASEAPSQGFTWEKMLDNDVPEDELFKLKLAMFEDEVVQSSKKTTQKQNLRKSESVTQAFYYYGLIKGVNGK